MCVFCAVSALNTNRRALNLVSVCFKYMKCTPNTFLAPAIHPYAHVYIVWRTVYLHSAENANIAEYSVIKFGLFARSI